LFGQARAIGANRLYIDPNEPCGGGAYFVPDDGAPPAGPTDAGAGAIATGAAATRPDASDADTMTPEKRRADSRALGAALHAWLLARWKRPPSISAAESRGLCVVVQFTVSPLRRVWKVNGLPVRSSGNREFDESVRAALESAIDEHATVPVPPRDLVGEHVEYRIEFTEGDPSICRRLPP
jgi:hypothetical protein